MFISRFKHRSSLDTLWRAAVHHRCTVRLAHHVASLQNIGNTAPPTFQSRCLSSKCWRCGSEAKLLPKCIKTSCGALQPLQNGTTFFDVLLRPDPKAEIIPKSIEPTFDIDLVQLKRNFRVLQQTVHPDIYTMKEEKERRLSEVQSSFINKAYETLRDPLKRSVYIVSSFL